MKSIPRRLSRFRFAYVVSFESKMSSSGYLTGALLPISDKCRISSFCSAFLQLIGVAEHPGVGS